MAAARPPQHRRSIRVLHEALIVIALAAGVYLYISLGSYSPFDGSGFSLQPGDKIANLGGRLGAFLAFYLLFVFGYTAYLAVAVMICGMWLCCGGLSRSERHWSWLVGTLLGMVMLLISTSSIEALRLFGAGDSLPDQRSGGILGFGFANMLYEIFGFQGATIILIGLWLSGLSMFANFTWLEAFYYVGLLVEVLIKAGSRILKMLVRVLGLTAQPSALSLSQLWSRILKLTSARKDENDSKALMSAPEPSFDPALQAQPTKRPRPSAVRKTPTVAPAQAKGRPQQRPSSKSISKQPPVNLLSSAVASKTSISDEELAILARLIENKLAEFGVEAKVVQILPGPVITRYEISPASGVKGAQIVNLARELSRALAVSNVRILETIPGRSTMGLEVPNNEREMVRLLEVVDSPEFKQLDSPTALALGRDIAGKPLIIDLQDLPHLLMAGTTGSGKSVQINSMILSFLYKASPEQLRLILIDPKVVELAAYEGLPHLYAPVITDMTLAPTAINWCVAEMERRYSLMARFGARNLAGLNAAIARGEVDPENNKAIDALPNIVVIIDELADLMMVVGKKVEMLISRLAQKARAAGINLILATQRPSVDVITGLIKANVPGRIAFQVASKIDSRTILDQAGAETLLGKGDMLYLPGGSATLIRVHGAYVSDEEVANVVSHVKEQAVGKEFDQVDFQVQMEDQASLGDNALERNSSAEDPEMYRRAVAVVFERKRASISMVQRHLRIGYNRAARLIEEMERNGVVTPMDESGARKIIGPSTSS